MRAGQAAMAYSPRSAAPVGTALSTARHPFPMRHTALPLAIALAVACPCSSLWAQPAAEGDDPYAQQDQPAQDGGDEGEPSLIERARVLVTEPGGMAERLPSSKKLTFDVDGEYQIRHRAFRDLRLEPPVTDPGADSLGQRHYLYHWLRLSPTLQYRKSLKVVGQIDFPRGMVLGEQTRYVGAARDGYDALKWYQARPRYLYVEYLSPIGMFRIGQQGSHWGMGLVANDGDHRSLFGDYLRGSLVERILFATEPLGREVPVRLVLAGDLVFEDRIARLADGDRALQMVGALLWQRPRVELGVYGVYRHQERDRESTGPTTPFTETLEVGVASLAGKFATPVEDTRALLFGQIEGALQMGTTDFLRNVDLSWTGQREQVQAFGGALVLGAVSEAGPRDKPWGQVVVSVELGYASGDADPGDGVSKRFTFEPNHNVGLVLFDHVLAWKTARAATIAQDPAIVARPSPGLDLLPSEGGIFGASYIYPTVVYRPQRWLDLKGGVVVAQTSADLVDPYHYGALGDFANYDGGDETRHDLGLELDLGVDGRIEVQSGITIELGVEGGLLLPGHAFDTAEGEELPPQYLLNSKLGLRL